jgi:hypothetical protein
MRSNVSSRNRWFGTCFGFLLSFSAIESVSAENAVDDWLTERLAARRAAVAEATEERATETQVALGTRSTANQLETPAASTNATSLGDSSSAADLASIALNLAGLSGSSQDGDEEQDVTSASATLSAYALWSAWDGRDPLGPAYCDPSARISRSFSGTLGFDDETNGPDNRVVLYGGKFELAPFLWALTEKEPGAAAGTGQDWIDAWRAGDPCDQASWERVQSKVEAAAPYSVRKRRTPAESMTPERSLF